MGLFGKSDNKTIKEQVREWQSKLRKEGFHLDRQLRGIDREEQKVKMELKKAAKSGDKDVCRVFAKELIRSRKAKNRIHSAKAQLNSINCHLTQQLAMHRISQSIQKSTDVMKCMQNLVKYHEISAVMQELSREMMKAGIIEEMMEETLEEGLGDQEDIEEAAEEEIDKVLWEITAGQLGAAPAAVTDTLPSTSTAVKEPEAAAAVAEAEEDISEMQKRLEALRS